MKQTRRGTISRNDFFKGLWLSVSNGVLAIGLLLVQNHWVLPTFQQLDPYLTTIGIAFVTYLGKQFGTNSDGEFKKENNDKFTGDS